MIQGQTLTGIADAIRAQLGTEKQYTPESMAAAIESIKGVDAPEESILKISALGTGLASVSPSAAGKMQGLTLYGRSWQDGTPSVETEVPIEDAGQSGTVDVTVAGANIFDVKSTITGYYASDGRFISTNVNRQSTKNIPVRGQKFVTFGDLPVNVKVIAVQFDESEKLVYREGNITNGKVFSIQDQSAYVAFSFYKDDNSLVSQSDLTGVMINYGETVLPFEPYVNPQQFTIPTPDGLPGIPVDSGGNWVDENGQQWVSDVVDLAAGTKTQSLVRYPASELIFVKDFYTSQEGTTIHRFSTKVNSLWKDGGKALCNIFSWVFRGSKVMVNFQTEESKIRLFFDDSYETKEQVSQFLADKNAEFLVQLATPVNTTLTAEEIATYKALQSYDSTTNVIAPDAGIEATAYGNAAEYVSQHTAIQDAAQAAKILLGMEDV